MLKLFWIVVLLVALLLIPNARYAVRQYMADRNKLIFTVYMVLLITLGYMVVSLTTHLLEFVQTSQEVIETP